MKLIYGSSPNNFHKERMTLIFICRIRKSNINHQSKKMASKLSLAITEFQVKKVRETQITKTGHTTLCFGYYRNKKRLGNAHAR